MKKRNIIALIILVLILIGIGIFGYMNLPETQAPTKISEDASSDSNNPFLSSDDFYTIGKLRVGKNIEGDPNFSVEDGLEDLSLCGGTYKVHKIFIDGVEIMPRIAQVFANNKKQNDAICGIWRDNATQKEEGGQATDGSELYMVVAGNNESYELDVALSVNPPKGDFPLFINVEKNTITTIGGGVVGQLKEKESGA